jgi:hypothetical protein
MDLIIDPWRVGFTEDPTLDKNPVRVRNGRDASLITKIRALRCGDLLSLYLLKTHRAPLRIHAGMMFV